MSPQIPAELAVMLALCPGVVWCCRFPASGGGDLDILCKLSVILSWNMMVICLYFCFVYSLSFLNATEPQAGWAFTLCPITLQSRYCFVNPLIRFFSIWSKKIKNIFSIFVSNTKTRKLIMSCFLFSDKVRGKSLYPEVSLFVFFSHLAQMPWPGRCLNIKSNLCCS